MNPPYATSPVELAEHERAAAEVTRLRRKGIRCHLECHSEGVVSHVDVVRDAGLQTSDAGRQAEKSRSKV